MYYLLFIIYYVFYILYYIIASFIVYFIYNITNHNTFPKKERIMHRKGGQFQITGGIETNYTSDGTTNQIGIRKFQVLQW